MVVHEIIKTHDPNPLRAYKQHYSSKAHYNGKPRKLCMFDLQPSKVCNCHGPSRKYDANKH